MQTLNQTPRRRLSTLKAAVLAAVMGIPLAQAGDTFKWTVQYVVDNSQKPLGESQAKWPRYGRGLALSPDGAFLYAGYNHGPDGVGEVRRISTTIDEDYSKATISNIRGPQGKAICCDDKGRVYIASNSEVLVYDPDLTQLLMVIRASKIQGVQCEGIAVVREGESLVLYASDRNAGAIYRLLLEEKGDGVAGFKPDGFDGTGLVRIPGARDLRGIEVDSKGQIWVADKEGGRVFRVSKDGKEIKDLVVSEPIDIAVEGNRAYVSRSVKRMVSVVDTDSLALLGDLAVPWDQLELTPTGNDELSGLGAIVSIPGKGFFVTNEGGQTAHQKSTYGKVDANSDKIGNAVYRDARGDDNEPILRALEVKE